MFKIKAVRFAALVLVVAGAAFLVSCRAEVTAPAPVREKGKTALDSAGIYGYTYKNVGGLLLDVWVEWECETCAEYLGGDAVDDVGRYDIYYEGDWSEHDGRDMRGYASKTGWETAENTITNFQSNNMPYRRDFILYPE